MTNPRARGQGGRVTPKGTRPPEPSTRGGAGGSPAATPPRRPSVDPVRDRRFAGHAAPGRSAHRGNR